MKSFPKPITTENFNDAAKFLSMIHSSSIKKSLIKKIVKPVGGILFVFLSFLLVYGAIFNLSDSEDLLVFNNLAPITKIWEGFSGILTTADMAWYIYWPILIVAAFAIPIIISAIITLIVSICYKPKGFEIPEGTEAEKAKALHETATKIKSNDYESDAYEIFFSITFIVLLAALIIYAFITLEIEFAIGAIIGSLIGVAIVGAIIYYIYSLIFLLFASFNGNFYQNKYYGDIVAITDEYWLSVDPDEAARRKEEEERRALEAEQKRTLGAEKRIRALEVEKSGQYALAKQLFKESAELGDALGMDNYARHCLINGNRSDAIYWLERSIKTGEADYESEALLRALKNGENINAHYN